MLGGDALEPGLQGSGLLVVALLPVRPSRGRHNLFEPVQQLFQRQGDHDVTVLVVALFRDEAGWPRPAGWMDHSG